MIVIYSIILGITCVVGFSGWLYVHQVVGGEAKECYNVGFLSGLIIAFSIIGILTELGG